MGKYDEIIDKMVRPRGMHPLAFDAYKASSKASGMPPLRIVQTCTGALGPKVDASAGTHDKDGVLPSGEAYSACVDLSVWQIRGVKRWDATHIKWALFCFAEQGLGGWFRYRNSFFNNRHMHLLYFGTHMKPACQLQCRDFLNGRTGLKGHDLEPFWTAPQSTDAKLKAMFTKANPECAHWFK